MKNIANLCYPKWALQAFVVANAERYDRTAFSLKSFYKFMQHVAHWVLWLWSLEKSNQLSPDTDNINIGTVSQREENSLNHTINTNEKERIYPRCKF